MIKRLALTLATALIFVGCGEVSYVQKESPANPYKDFEQRGASVLGVGEPISKRQMHANATLSLRGSYTLTAVMDKIAKNFNVAIRWGNGVRRGERATVLIADLKFNELRSYIEDVYDIQIVREGERRLYVLPSANEPRIDDFSPGINVSLSQAIRGLAQQCNYNLVISENKKILSETLITTTLKDVTCFDAFEALLTPHSLSLVDQGDFYSISGLPHRQWTLNLYEPKRTEEVEVSYESVIESSDSGGGSGGSSGEQSSGGKATVTVSQERDLWAELESDLNIMVEKSCESAQSASAAPAPSASVLPPPTLEGGSVETTEALAAAPAGFGGSFECGFVRVNRSIGLIQMRAPLNILAQADEFIRHVEDIAGRRLYVEARVMAVTRTRDYERGSNIAHSSGLASSVGEVDIGFQPGTSIASTISAGLRTLDDGGGIFGVRNSNLNSVVRLVETFGTTYQLMQPTMEVMDRQRATLIDGRNERYFISERETETIDTNIVTNLTREERTQFVGLQFSVAAQIAENGEPHTVSLQIPITEISRFTQLTQVFESEEITDNIPITTTRLIDQKVRIRDGEIKVIGGLTRTIAIDTKSGIPVVREIPVFGRLAEEEDISYEEVEFIVLLQVRRLH